MNLILPAFMFERPPGLLIPYARENTVALFIREDEFGLRKYPPQCAADAQL
jgi:hypothetical protein